MRYNCGYEFICHSSMILKYIELNNNMPRGITGFKYEMTRNKTRYSLLTSIMICAFYVCRLIKTKKSNVGFTFYNKEFLYLSYLL
jgi:hypothetical protein